MQKTLRGRRGFTLVELLVVISIIALLAALLIPAAVRVRWVARQTAIKGEISNLETAIESYKNDVSGGSYPPDAMVGQVGTGVGQTPPNVANAIVADFKRHFRKAFPRSREPEALIEALVGARTAGSPTTPNNPNLPGGMTPAEAAVFWLQRFSEDPKYPISGTGGPAFIISQAAPIAADPNDDLAARNWIIDLTAERYGPRDDDNRFAGRFLAYGSPIDAGVTLQINFWQYYPDSSEEPIAYFDCSRGARDVVHPAFFSNTGTALEVFALKQLKVGAAVTGAGPFVSQVRLVNEGKFQLMHPGSDDDWGSFAAAYLNPAWSAAGFNQNAQAAVNADGEPVLIYPDGPFTLELGDTVINFGAQIALEDAQ